MKIIFLNGQFVREDEAKISVFDHGFLYGDGVYETLRTYFGRVWQAEAHVKRLFQSARYIGLTLPWSQKKIIQWLEESVERCRLNFQKDHGIIDTNTSKDVRVDAQADQEFRIRLTVSRGVNQFDFTTTKNPTICITVEPIVEEPKDVFEKGVSAITFPIQRFLPEAKTLNFLPSVLARRAMLRKHAYEAFFVDPSGSVLEGTISNIFLVKDGKLVTPKDGMLPGITRDTIIKISGASVSQRQVLKENFFPVTARKILKGSLFGVTPRRVLKREIFEADECFLTSTVKGIVPVVKMDGNKIGDGKVGEQTKNLIVAFEEYVRKCSG